MTNVKAGEKVFLFCSLFDEREREKESRLGGGGDIETTGTIEMGFLLDREI